MTSTVLLSRPNLSNAFLIGSLGAISAKKDNNNYWINKHHSKNDGASLFLCTVPIMRKFVYFQAPAYSTHYNFPFGEKKNLRKKIFI